MTKAETARVVDATVRTGKGGQGVLVAGGFILTAAHCISWDGRGKMTLGDYFLENVTTKSGARFRVRPVAADPVSDIAVLFALDDQTFFKDADAFEQWSEATSPVPLAFRNPLSIHILSHKTKWISGRTVAPRLAENRRSSNLGFEADDRVEGGTSGGPIVDSSGRLVGVVSWSGGVASDEKCQGAFPIARMTLPPWVLLSIRAAEKSGGALTLSRSANMSRKPVPPEYLKGTARTLFVMIGEGLVKSGVDLRECDAIQIEGLARDLEGIRRARKQAREKPESAKLLGKIEAKYWQTARSVAKELKLPEEALKRLAWEH